MRDSGKGLSEPIMTACVNGVLLVDKPEKYTSFDVVARMRTLSKERCVGHGGTLDPLATGLLIILIGRAWTKQSQRCLFHDKEYASIWKLGSVTDTYDREGSEVSSSSIIPSYEEVVAALSTFQGHIEQIPPMFSAKKIGGKKLYTLARQGLNIERKPCLVHVITTLIAYEYPYVQVRVACSKGTYIRSMAHDFGQLLGCGAHIHQLRRTRSGPFSIENSFPLEQLSQENLAQALIYPDFGHA